MNIKLPLTKIHVDSSFENLLCLSVNQILATSLQHSTMSRSRLLQAVRGHKRLCCIPIYRHQVQESPKTPQDFHQRLCKGIQSAQRRVQLASLYIGPAAEEHYRCERQLLTALQSAASRQVPIDILLDYNRALRPVPYQSSTITSADACFSAIQTNADHTRIYLLSVLPEHWQRLLKNPLNEVAGVFHIKAYIVDDDLFLSGANLSQEYFIDRMDRYWHVRDNPLVQWYADLLAILCESAAVEYQPGSSDAALLSARASTQSRRHLAAALERLLTDDSNEDESVPNVDAPWQSDADPVAYAVPTIQVPFLKGLRQHETVQQDLLQACSSDTEVRLATAYLNPTAAFLSAVQHFSQVLFLTAGPLSHGFKPQPKAGNKGKAWIPHVFAYAAQQITGEHTKVAYYQRPGWTFHAKGMWLTRAGTASTLTLAASADVLVLSHGSGNFGERSAKRDMESNVLLFLPPQSPLASQAIAEWNALCAHADETSADTGDKKRPEWLPVAFPLIRSFF